MNNFDTIRRNTFSLLRKTFLPGRSYLDFAMLPLKVLLLALSLVLVVVSSWRGCVYLQARQSYPAPPEAVTLRRNVSYVQRDWQNLTMDIATPKQGQGPFPAVVCIHGGGWKSGNKKEMLPCLYALAQQGCVAVSIDYRLAPDHHFLDQVDDCKAAVRFLRTHAQKLNINAQHIGALGSSAGGHLALLLGTTDTKELPIAGDDNSVSSAVEVVVSLAGPTDLTKELPTDSERSVEKFIGKTRLKDLELFKRASPIHYLSSGDAPTMIIHGTKDQMIPFEQATDFLEACKKIGVECQLLAIKNGGHSGGGSIDEWNSSMVQMEKFLLSHLKLLPSSALGL
jgi:acetyl esterase/lipase